MEKIIAAVRLENAAEADVMESILREEGIPHMIRSFHDSAYDGLFQAQKGWGQVEAPAQHQTRIRELYARMKEGNAGPRKG